MIRKKTLAELQAESRERQMMLKQKNQAKKRQEQQQAYKRKRQMQQHLAKIEQHENEKEERLKFNKERSIENRWWMCDDTELYTTIDELKEAEKRGEGKINWELWEKLIQKGNK